MPWVRELARVHKPWVVWVHFLLDLYTPYVAFRTVVRTANYRVSRVAIVRYSHRRLGGDAGQRPGRAHPPFLGMLER